MVKLWIDNQEVNVEKGTTILNAAASVGIKIPTLCFLKDLNEIGACRVCIVEIKGKDALVAACNTAVEEGMEIYTNSKRVMNARRTNVGLILSQHDYRCATCVRSGNCSLQKLANDLDILNVPFKEEYEDQEWNMDFPLIRDAKKCIKCMRCVQVCNKIQGMKVWDIINTGKRTNVGLREGTSIEDINCALCGQCITHCPVGALRERDDLNELVYAIADKKKVVVAQIAPAVRAAWGERFGLKREDATVKRLVAALRRTGIDYVFDTNFTADLTIMEEANEFIEKVKVKAKQELETVPVINAADNSYDPDKEILMPVRVKGKDLRVLKDKEEKVTVKCTTKKVLQAPVKKGTVIGKAEYYIGEEKAVSYPIVAMENVSARTSRWYLQCVLEKFLF